MGVDKIGPVLTGPRFWQHKLRAFADAYTRRSLPVFGQCTDQDLSLFQQAGAACGPTQVSRDARTMLRFLRALRNHAQRKHRLPTFYSFGRESHWRRWYLQRSEVELLRMLWCGHHGMLPEDRHMEDLWFFYISWRLRGGGWDALR